MVVASTLSQELREGRDAIRAALTELTEAGYLVRHTYQDSAGRWQKVTWLTALMTEDGFPGVGGPGVGFPGGHATDQPNSHIANSHKYLTSNEVRYGTGLDDPSQGEPQEVQHVQEAETVPNIPKVESEPETSGLWGSGFTPVKKTKVQSRWDRPVNTWSNAELLGEFKARVEASMHVDAHWLPIKRVMAEFKNLRVAGYGPDRLVAAMDIWFADSRNLREQESPAWARYSTWVRRHYSKILEVTGERRSTYDEMDEAAHHIADASTARF